MCIAILSTAHPEYPFILLDNRDEWLDRPTADADFWPAPYSHVLGGRDLQRAVHGTWLGVTRRGRVAVLTNYLERTEQLAIGAQSRGAIVNGWLQSAAGEDETASEFAQRLLREGQLEGVGGFILMYGRIQDVVRATRSGAGGNDDDADDDGQPRLANGAARSSTQPRGLAVLSNRASAGSETPLILQGPGQTIAVSNAPFGDRSWPKVRRGEALLDDAIRRHVAAREGREQLVARLMAVLDDDTMPEWDGEEDWARYARRMEDTVFLRKMPLLGPESGGGGGDDGLPTPVRKSSPNLLGADASSPAGLAVNKAPRGYGTSKQTVVLVSREGRVTYVERTLWDEKERSVPEGERDRVFQFDIEGW